jgi:outer membrane receptor protein involved in Fe transport
MAKGFGGVMIGTLPKGTGGNLDELNLSVGVRYDHSNLLVSYQQVSPRLGAVYYLRKTHTAVRASYSRLYMPPQVENLLIANSEQARALSPFASSGGGADIRPETLSAWEVGFTQELPHSLRLNTAYWWRHFQNIDDPNVLFSSTIIFPNSVARAEAKGLDVRLEVRIRRGFSAYFSYTNNRIVGAMAIFRQLVRSRGWCLLFNKRIGVTMQELPSTVLLSKDLCDS